MKRLKDAHGHLAKAFDTSGAIKTAMTATLQRKSGQLALKCVTEALPVAESLLHNWDNAWGSQMHHLTARAESADIQLDKQREQTEAALAEAEAYRAETVRAPVTPSLPGSRGGRRFGFRFRFRRLFLLGGTKKEKKRLYISFPFLPR